MMENTKKNNLITNNPIIVIMFSKNNNTIIEIPNDTCNNPHDINNIAIVTNINNLGIVLKISLNRLFISQTCNDIINIVGSKNTISDNNLISI